MATSKSIPPASGNAVTLSPNRDIFDLQDIVETKARQLHALLAMTYGEENIRVMSDQLQDTYLWACYDMAADIVQALDDLSERRRTQAVEVQHG